MEFELGDKVKLSEIDGQGFCDMVADENPDFTEKYRDPFHKVYNAETYEGLEALIVQTYMDGDDEWYHLKIDHPELGDVRLISIKLPDGEWTTKLTKVE